MFLCIKHVLSSCLIVNVMYIRLSLKEDVENLKFQQKMGVLRKSMHNLQIMKSKEQHCMASISHNNQAKSKIQESCIYTVTREIKIWSNWV